MDKWVLFTKFGRSINHSCEPNCGVGFNGTHWYYKAFRDIKKGEELLYDYAMANYKVENFPRCLCGSARCRNDIKGYRTLPI
jgi:SET domain-containing protein